MKNKVKPNKQGANPPFINHTQNERGITLIALIVMIILLVILTMVVIRGITGEEGIIEVSTTATEEYNILQYKEQIEALRENIILKYEMTGEKLSLEKLAREMETNTTWIKKAVANTDKDISNEDIIVTTIDGYIFQLYYDINYGQKFIEYLGIEDRKEIPRVIARYDKETNKLSVVGKEETEGINKIEIIHKGGIVKAENSNVLEYEPIETGWYIVRVTANSGKIRYAWIRVSSTMVAPIIEITEHGEQENGWYGKDNVAVVVRITATGDKVKEIHYTKDRWQTEEIANDKQVTLEGIRKSGTTTIFAYTVDENGNESDIARLEVNYDNTPPEINKVEIEGRQGNNGWMTSEVRISLKNAKDANSGIGGFYYKKLTEEDIENNKIYTKEEMEYIEDINKKIEIGKGQETDGITVIALIVKDKAGNSSGYSTVEIKKDETPPHTPKLSYSDVTANGFTLKAETADDLGGPITYKFYTIINGTATFLGTSQTGRVEVTGLDTGREYNVYVEAYDEAGNMSSSLDSQNGQGYVTIITKKTLNAPDIIVRGETGNGWYRGNVIVTIRDRSKCKCIRNSTNKI